MDFARGASMAYFNPNILANHLFLSRSVFNVLPGIFLFSLFAEVYD